MLNVGKQNIWIIKNIMKKLLLLFLLFIPLLSFGQEFTNSDGIPLREISAKYIFISKAQVYNKKTYVSIDSGQELKTGLSPNAIRLNGKKHKFSSILNVINILDNYTVVQFEYDETSIRVLLKYIKE